MTNLVKLTLFSVVNFLFMCSIKAEGNTVPPPIDAIPSGSEIPLQPQSISKVEPISVKKLENSSMQNVGINADATTLPSFVDNDSGRESPLQPQPQQQSSQVVMSVWAKKAGGNLKPEYLNNNRNTPEEIVTKIQSKSEQNKKDSREFSESASSSIFKSEKVAEQNEIEEERESVTESSETVLNHEKVHEKSYFYDDSEEKEEECPEEDQFWHIRGKRCVPVHCPGGNHWRNVDTGVCILRQLGSPWGRRRYNRRNKVYKSLSGRTGGRIWRG